MLTLTLVDTTTPTSAAVRLALTRLMPPVALPSRLKPSSSVTPSVTALVTPRYMSPAARATPLAVMASSETTFSAPDTVTSLLNTMSSVLRRNSALGL